MIDSELKDKTLNFIIENAPDLFIGFDIHEMASEYGVSYRIIDALLSEYENRDFMSVDRMLGGVVHCNLSIKSHDFVRSGGYKFEETLADINLQKLTLEIESLQSSIPAVKYNTIIAAVGAISSALALFKR